MKRRRSEPAALALLGLLAGCERREVPLFGGEEPGPLAGILRVEVRPTSAMIVADGVNPAPDFVFQAIGIFEDGERDISAHVSWRLQRPELGAIGAGVFRAHGTVGGETLLTALAGDLSSEASITVRLEVTSIGPSVPADVASRFPEDLSGDHVAQDPELIYPADGTVFPPNVSRTLFQWRGATPADLYELRFDSSLLRLRYYTSAREWQLDAASEGWLPRTHAGRSVTLTVRAISTTSTGTPHRSAPITLRYGAFEVRGAIYYWSTGARGIMRATLESPSAVAFLPAAGDDTCTSCHTVSRDGRRVAAGSDGEKLQVASIPDRRVIAPAPGASEEPYGWGSFDPSGRRLLFANKGRLALLDLESNAITSVTLPGELAATHPDWSPDGTQVALALAEDSVGNKDAKGTSLARLPVMTDGTFGPPQILVPSEGEDDTIVFPSHSPDGAWIAFVRARGKSKDNEEAEIYLIRADGAGPPILLEALNRTVGPNRGRLAQGNSMPTWAPRAGSGEDWLAFSSLRDYGEVIVETKRDQLWVSAIDLSRAVSGLDPSVPAFWLPFQASEEGNHRAFWSINPEDECPSTVELCNGLDDDCDGVIDEQCCTPGEELCGDGLDNDCDQLTDEGCGCAEAEVCVGGLDEDCDGLVDLADEDCSV